MIEIGDKVKIVKVCKAFSDDDENEQYGWSHGIVGTVKIVGSDMRQPYYVEFEKRTNRRGLWCSYVEKVYDEIILPKELFEI